jgi:hypothetical protein
LAPPVMRTVFTAGVMLFLYIGPASLSKAYRQADHSPCVWTAGIILCPRNEVP